MAQGISHADLFSGPTDYNSQLTFIVHIGGISRTAGLAAVTGQTVFPF